MQTVFPERLIVSPVSNLVLCLGRFVVVLGVLASNFQCLSLTVCFAGGGPENVFLLVNPTSQDSLTVANHYIAIRKIPEKNIFYLPFTGSKVEIHASQFRDQILSPTFKELEKRKLAGQIDYVVYSCDFPWKVNFTKDFPGEQFPSQFNPRGSITSATYLWVFTTEKRKEIVGLNTNLYFRDSMRGLVISRAFRSRYRWAVGGNRADKTGMPYMISAMLGVTDGRGNSVDEVVRSLQTAKQADRTKPSGTVYFVKNDGPRSTPRHDFYQDAATELRKAGVEAKILTGNFPENKRNIVGLTTGTAHADIPASGCRFLPGALCDNLTSLGALLSIPKKPIDPKTGLKRKLQVSVCDFIRAGATAACGTVHEPYNFRQKFPHPSVHVHYAHGCSLAEAFYQSVAGPYQQLLIGDPLCQPWAEEVGVKVTSPAKGAILKDTIEIVAEAEVAAPRKIRFLELYIDGSLVHRKSHGVNFKLDTTTLDDGYHELRVVAVDDSPIETQGRWIGSVIVKNGRDAVELSVDPGSVESGIQELVVKVAASSPKPVGVWHNGRQVGLVKEGSGVAKIKKDQLGSGPITLYGRVDGDPSSRSQAVQVNLP